ncbi:MAG: PG0541 family transporter-associated protein [Candidatus Omnitrophota bacterium]
MKMVMISYNEAMDMEVMEVLGHCALKNYTKITGVFGKGSSSGTHLGDDIWPGKNNVLYIACETEGAHQLLSCVKNLRKQLGKEGIKAFVWDLDEIT